MIKQLLVVALTGLGVALVLPANADIKFKGKFYPAYVKTSGGEAGDGEVATSTLSNNDTGHIDETLVEAFNSNIRISGERDAGGGLTFYFQCETALRFDDAEGTWCGRNSAVGIKGGFGRVFLGQWDTPFKQVHFPTNMFGVSSGSPLSNSNILSRTPYSGGSSRASFHRRQDNMVQYWSPDFSGVQFKAMWGTEENDTATPERRRKSVSVEWEQGPLYVGAAYEIHDDFNGATTGLGGALTAGVGASSEDTGIALAAVYKLGKTTEIGVELETLNYENDTGSTGAVKEYERDAWRFGVEHKIANLLVALNYGSADAGSCSLFGGAACSTDGLGATQLSFGGLYSFAKNLGVYAWYTKIDNDNSASYSFLDDAPTGADPTAVAIGIFARF